MAHALNLTIRIRQDAAAQATLAKIAAMFAVQIQPKIDKALRESKIVHFARVLVIDNKYLQVITEYDGDPRRRPRAAARCRWRSSASRTATARAARPRR